MRKMLELQTFLQITDVMTSEWLLISNKVM